MIIHNVMEDIVYTEVNKLFDEAEQKKESWVTCSCVQCRRDVMCYVLNRIKPRYIKSGRGLAHFLKFEKDETTQIKTDVTALIMEGMRKVLSTRRPHETEAEETEPDGPVFNFPAITGKVLNGNNFKPMDNVKVTLKSDNQVVRQTNILWDNPYTISDKTPGIFTFCPKSIPLDGSEKNEPRKIPFVIIAEKEGFDTVTFLFNIEVKPENEKKSALDSSYFHQIKDLFLFEKTDEE